MNDDTAPPPNWPGRMQAGTSRRLVAGTPPSPRRNTVPLGHDPCHFTEFRRRYRLELATGLQAGGLRPRAELARCQNLTLLTASRTPATSEGVVLGELLAERPPVPQMPGPQPSGYFAADVETHRPLYRVTIRRYGYIHPVSREQGENCHPGGLLCSITSVARHCPG
jgi:hypothetical protein